MKTPKKPITKKLVDENEDLDDDYKDTPKKKVVDEDEDDFDLPLDDLEPFDNFEDDEDDF